MIRNSKSLIVKGSRSYGGMQTKSDHRPVIAKINIKWKYIQHQKRLQKINFELFRDQNNINAYNNTVSRILKNQPKITSTQDKWTNIMNITKQAAVETLGYVSKIVKYENHEIKELSKQKKIKDIDRSFLYIFLIKKFHGNIVFFAC